MFYIYRDKLNVLVLSMFFVLSIFMFNLMIGLAVFIVPLIGAILKIVLKINDASYAQKLKVLGIYYIVRVIVIIAMFGFMISIFAMGETGFNVFKWTAGFGVTTYVQLEYTFVDYLLFILFLTPLVMIEGWSLLLVYLGVEKYVSMFGAVAQFLIHLVALAGLYYILYFVQSVFLTLTNGLQYI